MHSWETEMDLQAGWRRAHSECHPGKVKGQNWSTECELEPGPPWEILGASENSKKEAVGT